MGPDPYTPTKVQSRARGKPLHSSSQCLVSLGEDCLHAGNYFQELGGVYRLSTWKVTTARPHCWWQESLTVLCLESHLGMSLSATVQAGGPSARAPVLREDSEGFILDAGEAVAVQDLSRSGRQSQVQQERARAVLSLLSVQQPFSAP